jgi:hypothetical protein
MKNILQVGACGGKDNVMDILSNGLSEITAHLIEPLPANFSLLINNYKNIETLNNSVQFYNCAISTYTGKLTLYYQKELKNNINNLDEHCSFSYNHLLAHGHEGNIEKIEVPCYTLCNFIDHFNISKTIEHLYIDTEGHDCDILLSTNFDKLDIKNITFEVIHSDGAFSRGNKLQKTFEHLQKYEYILRNQSNFDITVGK